MLCGIDLIGLLVAAIILALAFAILQWVISKVPVIAGASVIINWIFWAIVAIFVLLHVVKPLFGCAGI